MKAKLKSNDSIITMNDTTNDTDTDTTPIKDDDDDIEAPEDWEKLFLI